MIIISGGQTGIDQIALEEAKALGLRTGGWMPKAFLTEDGEQPELAKKFRVNQCSSIKYPVRTEMNVKAADITLIFNRSMGTGSRLTQRLCKKHGVPCLVNPEKVDLRPYTIINIAGTRGSRLTDEDKAHFRGVIRKLLQQIAPISPP